MSELRLVPGEATTAPTGLSTSDMLRDLIASVGRQPHSEIVATATVSLAALDVTMRHHTTPTPDWYEVALSSLTLAAAAIALVGDEHPAAPAAA